jgi:hypothetical protein
MAVPDRNCELPQNQNNLLNSLSLGSVIQNLLRRQKTYLFYYLSAQFAAPWTLPPDAATPLARPL